MQNVTKVEEWHPAAHGRPDKFVPVPVACGNCALQFRTDACKAQACAITDTVKNRGR